MGFRHIYILAVALLFGCEVHQFPEPKSFGMILHLHYEPDFYVWEHYYDPALGSISPIAPPLVKVLTKLILVLRQSMTTKRLMA